MHEGLSPGRVRVWDLPTRLFHWALALCFVGLIATGTLGGSAMVLHFRFGYAVLALLLFRLIWGVVGGRWSRFSSFVAAPGTIWRYLSGRHQAEGELGHSTLGGLAVVAMLLLLSLQVGSGLMSDDTISFAGPLSAWVPNDWVSLATSYHARVGRWALIALVVLHLAAIIFYTVRRRGLVEAMLHGDKVLSASTAAPLKGSRDDGWTRLAALVLLLVCSGMAYWVSSLAPPTF
jgi:cytochrome b